jgi:hypothetical protein
MSWEYLKTITMELDTSRGAVTVAASAIARLGLGLIRFTPRRSSYARVAVGAVGLFRPMCPGQVTLHLTIDSITDLPKSHVHVCQPALSTRMSVPRNLFCFA